MTKTIGLLFLLSSCSSCASFQHPKYNSELSWREYESTYFIKLTCEEGIYQGSAVAISPVHLLTAKHVAECPNGLPGQLTATGSDEVERPVTVAAMGDGDVALLRAPYMPVYSRVVHRSAQVGETVCIIGAREHMRKCGDVAYEEDDGYAVSLHVVPGNSGGPVFDQDGNVIGVVSKGRWQPSMEFALLFVSSTQFTW